MTELDALDRLTGRLLAISEVYGRRFDIDRGGDWALLKLQEEVGELTRAHLAATNRSRRSVEDGEAELAAEIADVVAMALVYAGLAGIDVATALRQKWLVYPTEWPQDPVN